MSARTRKMKRAGLRDFPTRDQSEFAREQQHLARRATAVPSKKKVQDKRACRRFSVED